MAAAGWGRIVTTGSAVTLHPRIRNLACISSRAAVHGFIKALANELGDKGIAVNASASPVVKTEGFSERRSAGGPTADDMMDDRGAAHIGPSLSGCCQTGRAGGLPEVGGTGRSGGSTCV